MNKKVISTLIAGLLLLTACQPQVQDVVKASFPDGSPQLVYHVKGSLEKGSKVGETRYYSNGKTQSEKYYQGKAETPSGVWQYYYPTGSTFATADYSVAIPVWRFFDREGSDYVTTCDSVIVEDYGECDMPATVLFMQDSMSLRYQFYSNCLLRSTGALVEGRKEGRWLFYHPNGTIQTDASFAKGRENGPYTVYRENGVPYYAGTYDGGRRVGKWEFYDEEGRLQHTQEFK